MCEHNVAELVKRAVVRKIIGVESGFDKTTSLGDMGLDWVDLYQITEELESLFKVTIEDSVTLHSTPEDIEKIINTELEKLAG